MDKKVEIEIYKYALIVHQKDFVPYSLCVCIKEAIVNVHGIHTESIHEIHPYVPTFIQKRPNKNIGVASHWWNKEDKEIRTEYLNDLIKQLEDYGQ